MAVPCERAGAYEAAVAFQKLQGCGFR